LTWAWPPKDPGNQRQAEQGLLQHGYTFSSTFPEIGKRTGSGCNHQIEASSHAFQESGSRRLRELSGFQSARANKLRERQKWWVLECRVAGMNVRVNEAWADDALIVSVHLLLAKLPNDSIPNADVTLQWCEIVAIDYGSLQEDLTRLRHILMWSSKLFSSYSDQLP
jgi:hypothetical protein